MPLYFVSWGDGMCLVQKYVLSNGRQEPIPVELVRFVEHLRRTKVGFYNGMAKVVWMGSLVSQQAVSLTLCL